MFKGLCGTVGYMAPEQLQNEGHYDNMVDIWACGIVLFIMVAGEMPFQGENMEHTNQLVKSADINMTNDNWKRCSP